MWTVTSKIISVTCMVPCQDEELYREFELKCRMYPPDGRELNVTETLTGGRAVLNLADIKSVQTLVVELLYNDTVIDNSTVIITEDEGGMIMLIMIPILFPFKQTTLKCNL